MKVEKEVPAFRFRDEIIFLDEVEGLLAVLNPDWDEVEVRDMDDASI
tara:strand:+ start:320 stop:460 length:141 start_codon:yes stop_codon:yes gene_type:complete